MKTEKKKRKEKKEICMLGERDVHIVLFNHFFNTILLSTRIKVDLDLIGKYTKEKKSLGNHYNRCCKGNRVENSRRNP